MSSNKIRDVVPPAEAIEAGEAALSPVAILRAQAERWTERTGGDVVAEVEPARASSDRLAHWFSLVVPELDGYRYRLFRIEHGLEYYPLTIETATMTDAPIEIAGEEELYDELQRIFTADATLSIVRQLRSLVADQRAGSALR